MSEIRLITGIGAKTDTSAKSKRKNPNESFSEILGQMNARADRIARTPSGTAKRYIEKVVLPGGLVNVYMLIVDEDGGQRRTLIGTFSADSPELKRLLGTYPEAPAAPGGKLSAGEIDRLSMPAGLDANIEAIKERQRFRREAASRLDAPHEPDNALLALLR